MIIINGGPCAPTVLHEELITGSASDQDKFRAWAATVPKTLRNPLYHWTHLELKKSIWHRGNTAERDTADVDLLRSAMSCLRKPEFSTCGLLKQMNVKVVCTTDDPVDTLEHHQKIAHGDFCPARVLPAFRPDKAMAVEDS